MNSLKGLTTNYGVLPQLRYCYSHLLPKGSRLELLQSSFCCAVTCLVRRTLKANAWRRVETEHQRSETVKREAVEACDCTLEDDEEQESKVAAFLYRCRESI
ncbi:unnamed protein product [Amoebophrya sp. A25]|nr:unnamed protein product [Amoebophrya sp. A25]|eukprot:GSA25T00007066001.1